jgi:MoCo/4Fe-4S cofactor protein with predicted Tat translocation signal
MSSPPAKQSPPQTGPRYWRSLDELAETPAFQEWLEREFPQGASEWHEAVSRRDFVKLMSASFLLAGLGLTGCRRPEELIYPFSRMPENYVEGVPQHYATAMPVRRGAHALVVKSMDGRPLKIEGNPAPPNGLRGTDRFAQASILELYDPDRAIRFLREGNLVAREAVLDHLAAVAKELAASGGEGVCILSGQSSSPSLARLRKQMSERFPKVRWFTHEAVDFDIHRQAATLAFQSAQPANPATTSGYTCFPRLDRAAVVVSLDCDFLGDEDDVARSIRDFARGRKIEKPSDTPNRLYAIEALLSVTGANADHRQRLPAAQIGTAAAHLAAEVLSQSSPAEGRPLVDLLKRLPFPAGMKPECVKECARDLLAHRGASLVLAGHRQPLAVHLLAHAMNQALGNLGTTTELHAFSEPGSGSLEALAHALEAGEVKTLLICGGNPAYTAPADLNWPAAQRKARSVIRLGYYEDETSLQCAWNLPAAHYLESWGDARGSDGTVLSVQPLIAPLFNGLTELELLARLMGLDTTSPYEIVRETFRSLVSTANFEPEWKGFLHAGFLKGSEQRHVSAPLNWQAVSAQIKDYAAAAVLQGADLAPGRDRLEIVFHRDYSVDDGRHANNGWLQEMPDPITKVCWDNVITLSVRTAKELGVYFENPEQGRLFAPVAALELEGRKIEGPVWVQPGQADYVIGLALGYGRERTGRVGSKTGYNAYRLRTSRHPHVAPGGRLAPAGRTALVAVTQDHWAMEGRPIVREANLEHFRQDPEFARQMDLEAHTPNAGPLYQNPQTKHPALKGLQQWGLAIDLNACVGCSTCVMACQSENNIPIVGRDQVSRGREMHWIRMDRYYSVGAGDPELTAPQVLNQPMLCQHCENAPCESVCPVNATVHDDEGLNVMVYNRCVGTRYCSNNCPYKVRRFNFFDYNQRPLDRLYEGPLAPKGMPDLVKMAKNPQVTVRMRGVMEKCTYCIQRIEGAKIQQKIKAGASGDVLMPDGAIIPACAQACPAEAIVFGDVADPKSAVSQLKARQRNYAVLGFLNTVPRTTYLARIRNPNPRMPDYEAQPLHQAEQARPHEHASADRHGASVPAAAAQEEKGGR